MANPLIDTIKIDVYEKLFSLYEEILKVKSLQKKKKSEQEELLRLDRLSDQQTVCLLFGSCEDSLMIILEGGFLVMIRYFKDFFSWFQNDLYKSAQGRTPASITAEELIQLMRWKLLKGKWRPRLVDLVSSNTPEVVEDVTARAIGYASNQEIEDAVNELCKLKGVGPATASAILASCLPTKCGFFSDEVAAILLKRKNLKYTLREYIEINEELQAISKNLNSQVSVNIQFKSI